MLNAQDSSAKKPVGAGARATSVRKASRPIRSIWPPPAATVEEEDGSSSAALSAGPRPRSPPRRSLMKRQIGTGEKKQMANALNALLQGGMTPRAQASVSP